MKNMFKMSGIIFLTVVLCFTLTACDEDENIGSQVTVSGSSLAKKIEWVQSHRSSGTTYTIDVTADEEISGYMLTSGNNKNMTIILNGNGKTISLKNDAVRWLFMIGDNVTLILNNITLKGHDHNRASLVVVAGKLVMNNGSKIINNRNGEGSEYLRNIGGGVRVNGTFIMDGGEISGNYAYIGGGIFISNGDFRIINGTIYGSNAADGLKNTAYFPYNGCAFGMRPGSAQYGTYNDNTWIGTDLPLPDKDILNADLYTSNTIKVVNGVLQ